jgi:chromatin-remodeling ATPase INO80
MQRPGEEEERRDRTQNSYSAARSPTSPTQRIFPRPTTFSSQYHPPPPASLPLPGPAYVERTPASPRASLYGQSTPRDSYYDPTTDSSSRRPAEPTSWHNGQAQTPQVGLDYLQTISSTAADVSMKNREAYNYLPASNESTKFFNGTYTSPVDGTFGGPRSPISHSHPSSRIGSISHSPRMAMASPIARHNNGASQPVIHSESTVSPSVSYGHL